MPFDANDPETKAALKAAVESAVTDATEKLDAKNKELLDDLKRTKADLRKTQDIKPEDVAAIEAERDKAVAELAAASKVAKEATAAAEKAAKALETESGFTQKLLIQDGLKSALIANGVKDEDMLDMAVAKFSSGAKVIVEGEERKALYGDKPLGDFIKEWAGTDAGKKFVAAPVNGGGGAPGGKGGEAGKTMTRAAFNNLDATAQMAFSKDGGTIVDATA